MARKRFSHLITSVRGPAYADLSVVGNSIFIEVPVRNECSLGNKVEEHFSSEARRSLVAVHLGTAPKHACSSFILPDSESIALITKAFYALTPTYFRTPLRICLCFLFDEASSQIRS